MELVRPVEGETVLDAGCGVGAFAYFTAKEGSNSFGFDYSVESIKAARTLTRRFGASGRTGFVVADCIDLPFRDGLFDKVLSIDFIEHITFEDKDKFLKEIHRVLKPDGVAILFTPNSIREKIGEIYWRMRRFLFGHTIPFDPLHFGLTNKYQFEPLLAANDFDFKLLYRDFGRSYLAKIPLLKNFLSLDLLWIIRKR
jgi:ubiquinone/menaquinone biosynthesis C-methylase UbiE